jgi:hypothetical protein
MQPFLLPGRNSAEAVRSVPCQGRAVPTVDPIQRETRLQAQPLGVLRREARGADQQPFIIERDEPAGERRVEVHRQQQAVELIEAILDGLALRPWLDVAGAQHLGLGAPGDGTAALPLAQQPLPEEVLSHPLHHESFDLGRLGQVLRHALELVK